MCMCDKCTKLSGIVLLLVGIGFLLVDRGSWTFWNLNWWTVLFLLMGIGGLGMAHCPMCQAIKKKK